MNCLLALLIVLIFVLLAFLVGHIILKLLNIEENQNSLNVLLKAAFGISSILILINFFGRITSSLNYSLLISLFILVSFIFWQKNETLYFLKSISNFIYAEKKNNFNFISQNKNLLIFLLIVNIIYGLTAFSSTKLGHIGIGDKHLLNINQLVAGTFPPRYSFLANVNQRNSYGADIISAVISKFSGANPELSLDFVSLIFLNLSILLLYALTEKFANFNPINKYLVPFGAFLAWGPPLNLFTKAPGENIPTDFFQKLSYLAQTKLEESAYLSGIVIHYFFAPSIGMGIFFFLIVIYLLFKLFEENLSSKVTLITSILLSSLVIIDFSKFVIIFITLLGYLIFSKKADVVFAGTDPKFTKLFFTLLASTLILGVIHGNWLDISKNYSSILTFYKIELPNLNVLSQLIKSNFILYLLFIIGFYRTFKTEQKWALFLFPYFLVGVVLASLITPSVNPHGKLLMSSNIIGVFVFPYAIDFIKNKLDIKENNFAVFYAVVFFVLCFSTILFWGFGDKEKPLLSTATGKITYTGLQKYYLAPESTDETTIIKTLKSKSIGHQAILTDLAFGELFTNAGLFAPRFLNPELIKKDFPVTEEAIRQNNENYRGYFDLNPITYKKQNIQWLYINQGLFRYLMTPIARKRLLDTYNNSGLTAIQSINKENILSVKELYNINPNKILGPVTKTNKKLKTKIDDSYYYLNEISNCPYFGIYNFMSNDFDGDKIADIAFLDKSNVWFIIHGKDLSEEKIDLNQRFFTNSKTENLLIPIPADYDGDSKTDIAIFEKGSGKWYVVNSSNSFVDQHRIGCYNFSEIPLPYDLDGDLKTDVACVAGYSSFWPSILSSTNTFRAWNIPINQSDIAIYSDIDGDKKGDQVVYKTAYGAFNIYLSSRDYNNGISIQLPLGNKESRIVLDDYDGDSMVDLATWSPKTGEWEIAYAKDLISSNINILSPIPAPFIGCDQPPQANNNLSQCAIHKFKLGKQGDIPMPGDYDGDGKSEIAVFHTKSGKLEILFTNGDKKVINLSKYRGLTPANFIGV